LKITYAASAQGKITGPMCFSISDKTLNEDDCHLVDIQHLHPERSKAGRISVQQSRAGTPEFWNKYFDGFIGDVERGIAHQVKIDEKKQWSVQTVLYMDGEQPQIDAVLTPELHEKLSKVNIQVLKHPGGCSMLWQPADVAKTHKVLKELLFTRNGDDTNELLKMEFDALMRNLTGHATDIYFVNLIEILFFILPQAFSAANIRKGFKEAGIYPVSLMHMAARLAGDISLAERKHIEKWAIPALGEMLRHGQVTDEFMINTCKLPLNEEETQEQKNIQGGKQKARDLQTINRRRGVTLMSEAIEKQREQQRLERKQQREQIEANKLARAAAKLQRQQVKAEAAERKRAKQARDAQVAQAKAQEKELLDLIKKETESYCASLSLNFKPSKSAAYHCTQCHMSWNVAAEKKLTSEDDQNKLSRWLACDGNCGAWFCALCHECISGHQRSCPAARERRKKLDNANKVRALATKTTGKKRHAVDDDEEVDKENYNRNQSQRANKRQRR